MMDFVSWNDYSFPTEWKVIKFHGSKPPTSDMFTNFDSPLTHDAHPSMRFTTAHGPKIHVPNHQPERKITLAMLLMSFLLAGP